MTNVKGKVTMCTLSYIKNEKGKNCMNWLNKLERKFGKYAIPNLTFYLIACYVLGFAISVFMPNMFSYLTLEPALILRGQVWRIVSWVLIPPSSFDLFTIIMLLFYYSLGKTLEQTWGTFRYNVYIFSGIIFTVIGAFVLYGIFSILVPGFVGVGGIMGAFFSTYYINMSIFLAFAASYPEMQVLLYFVIPIKMKWMGILYFVLIGYDFLRGGWPTKVVILASLLNFIVFFLSTRNLSPYNPKEIQRKRKFQQEMKRSAPSGDGPRHRCAVCGRTELDDPNLEFRYCSKCNGNYEYCQDHLFTHEHKK